EDGYFSSSWNVIVVASSDIEIHPYDSYCRERGSFLREESSLPSDQGRGKKEGVADSDEAFEAPAFEDSHLPSLDKVRLGFSESSLVSHSGNAANITGGHEDGDMPLGCPGDFRKVAHFEGEGNARQVFDKGPQSIGASAPATWASVVTSHGNPRLKDLGSRLNHRTSSAITLEYVEHTTPDIVDIEDIL
ncbi:hypothetical protein U1Q18_051044, partial [Sarracenia purpurea var. burkii]